MPVDDSQVYALEKEAIRRIDDTYNHLITVTEQAAAKEVRGHRYQNQTGQLERNTVAKVLGATPDGGEIELVMNRPYASFVNERGFSRIDQVAAEADRLHREHLEKVAREIASK
jgi:hypothetical protein